MVLTILLRPILLGLIYQWLIKTRVWDMYQGHFPIIFYQIMWMRKPGGKFLTWALCLITEQSDVKTHPDYSLTLGFTLLYLPTLQKLDLCHIKTISNPYMGHIWVTHVQEIGLWTLSPRFLRGFHPPWAHDPFFQLVSGFPSQITWLPVGWAHDPFLTTGQRFLTPEVPMVTWLLSTNQEPPYATYERTLLLTTLITTFKLPLFNHANNHF